MFACFAKRSVVLIAVTCTADHSAIAADRLYFVRDLGPGTGHSVNGHLWVAGERDALNPPAQGEGRLTREAAVFLPTGVVVTFGSLGGESSHALGINDGGQVVGMAQNAAGLYRAFNARIGLPMTDMGVGEPAVESMALDISNDERVVAKVGLPSQPSLRLYVVDLPTNLTILLPRFDDDSVGFAYDIDDSGDVVGWLTLENQQVRGCRWLWNANAGTYAATMLGLPKLTMMATARTIGTAGVGGVVIVGDGLVDGSPRAIVWRDGDVESLGVPEGFQETRGLGVLPDGAILVEAYFYDPLSSEVVIAHFAAADGRFERVVGVNLDERLALRPFRSSARPVAEGRDGFFVNAPGAGGVEHVYLFTRLAAGDLNRDGRVDAADLGMLLGAWGKPGCGGSEPCAADVNGDGRVDALDLGILLGGWE